MFQAWSRLWGGGAEQGYFKVWSLLGGWGEGRKSSRAKKGAWGSCCNRLRKTCHVSPGCLVLCMVTFSLPSLDPAPSGTGSSWCHWGGSAWAFCTPSAQTAPVAKRLLFLNVILGKCVWKGFGWSSNRCTSSYWNTAWMCLASLPCVMAGRAWLCRNFCSRKPFANVSYWGGALVG